MNVLKSYKVYMEKVSKAMTNTRRTNKSLMLIVAWTAAIIGGITAIVQTSRVTALANELAEQDIQISSVSANDEQSDEIIPVSLYPLPENASYKGMKSYESYTAITDKTSAQYAVQTMAWTNEDAFRMVGNRYLVSVGTYFNAPVGTSIDIILENGIVIPCVVGDIKADEHTDYWGVYSANGCATEFIVDAKYTKAYVTGDVSDLYTEWQSKVSSIKVYDNTNVLSREVGNT